MYLQSWDRFGVASVECSGGCRCQPDEIDGWAEDRVSLVKDKLLHVHGMIDLASRALVKDACSITIQVGVEGI